MNLQPAAIGEKCSREKIAAYLDGDLKPQEELCLERHIAECADCSAEINLQKRMLSALDSAFDEKTEIELPENFAKVVAARAETSVKGLNSKRERTNAFFICVTLFSIVALALGIKGIIFSLNKFSEQVLAVISFAGNLAYDLTIGLTVILRSVGNQPVFNSAITFLFLAAALAYSAIVLFRRIDSSTRS